MNVHDFKAITIDGGEAPLSQYLGNVLLIVNLASRCGFTPQYNGLETLYEKYRDRGFAILGFPCNQFGGQEPGNENQIKEFCGTKYRVNFPLFAKIDVNGKKAHPLYRYLVTAKPGFLWNKRIKWNFTKFLIDRQGNPVKRYAPARKPEAIEADILKLLEEPGPKP